MRAPAAGSPHTLIQHAASFAPIWYVIADYTKSPYDLISLALVSRAFHSIFTRDYVWRYFNVHNLESGVLARFSRDVRGRREYSESPELTKSDFENEPSYVLLKCIELCDIPRELTPGTKLWWCYLRVARPRFMDLPECRAAALELLSWFPNATIRGAHVPQDREYLRRLLLHEKLVTQFNYIRKFSPIVQQFRNDNEIMILAMARCESFGRFAPPELVTTKEFAILAQHHTEFLRLVPKDLLDDFEYLLAACNGLKDKTRHKEYSEVSNFRLSPEILQQKHTYNVVRYASPRIKGDNALLERILDTTVVQNLESLAEILDRKLALYMWCKQMDKHGAEVSPMEDLSFETEMQELVITYPSVYKYATRQLQRDRSFLHSAVKGDGLLLRYAPTHLHADLQIRQAAYRQNPDIAKYLSGSWGKFQSSKRRLSESIL